MISDEGGPDWVPPSLMCGLLAGLAIFGTLAHALTSR